MSNNTFEYDFRTQTPKQYNQNNKRKRIPKGAIKNKQSEETVEEQHSKNTTQYVLDTNIRKQTEIT